MTSEDPDLHTLVGAYVLDAISADERARFAAHLAGCAACRAEIGELREAAASLGAAQAVRPRPELRDAAIRAARLTGQLGPVRYQKDSASGPGGPARGSRAIRWVAAAAAVIAVAGGVAAGTHYADTRGRQSHLVPATVSEVLLARDAVMRSAPVRTGGMAIVVASRRKHMAVFIAHGLHALPRTRRYELWLMGPRGERPAGLLTVHADGMAGPAVISGIAAGDMVGLTVEPASGSLKPTSPPVVMIGGQGR
jgi:anti-sigma-K factor RskA